MFECSCDNFARERQFGFLIRCRRCCRDRFQLREKIASSANALGTHFSHLDVNGSGVLETNEFRKALEEMNLGLEIDDFVFDCLMKSGAGASRPSP